VLVNLFYGIWVTEHAKRDMRYYETCETCETRNKDMNMGRKRNNGIWVQRQGPRKGSIPPCATPLLILGSRIIRGGVIWVVWVVRGCLGCSGFDLPRRSTYTAYDRLPSLHHRFACSSHRHLVLVATVTTAATSAVVVVIRRGKTGYVDRGRVEQWKVLSIQFQPRSRRSIKG
jgi:hypothetical protein